MKTASRFRQLSITAVLALATTVAAAQEESTWSGEGELGLTITTGNTDNRLLAAKLGLTRDLERWRHDAGLEALKSESEGTTNAERYVLRAKSDYKLDQHLYLFGSLRHEDDEFGSFDYQTTVAAGVGDRLFDDTQMTLDLSAGLGVKNTRIRAGGGSGTDTVIRLGAGIGYRFNANVSLAEDLLIEAGDDNTYVESATSLNAKISDSLAAKISYLIKHNTDVTAGIDKTDSLTTAALVYSF